MNFHFSNFEKFLHIVKKEIIIKKSAFLWRACIYQGKETRKMLKKELK
jgi:hypothetical protein